jgi:hypothetical protein
VEFTENVQKLKSINEQSFWLKKGEHNEHNQLFPKISPVSWLSSEQKLSTPSKRKKKFVFCFQTLEEIV